MESRYDKVHTGQSLEDGGDGINQNRVKMLDVVRIRLDRVG